MASRPQDITILLAEDDEAVRSLFQRILIHHGFQVFTAVDGKEAARIAREHTGTIDLLVSNVQMPEMTGPELARELRQTRPTIRVMLMSGYPDSLLLLDKGWAFLNKPILPADVLKKIEEVLEHEPAPEVDKGEQSGFPEPE